MRITFSETKIFLEINLKLQTRNKRLMKWKLSTETENGFQNTKKRGELSCETPQVANVCVIVPQRKRAGMF